MLFLFSYIPFIALQSAVIARSFAVSNYVMIKLKLLFMYRLSLARRIQSNTSGHFAKPPEKVYAFMGIHGGFLLATPSSTSVVKATNVNKLNGAIKVLRIHIPFLYFLFLFLAILKPVASTSNSAHPKKCQLRQRGLTLVPVPLPTSPAGLPIKSPTGSSIGIFNSSWEYFDFSKEKVRGVNLGGWFVLEPWITPSFFIATNNTNIVDEFTLGQMLGYDTAQEMLEQHWATWYTQDDFMQIAAANLNFVRIPLGYWSIPSNESVAPYHPGAYPYFKQALIWAREQGIHVIVDLHGAPGSQNGYDNSGQRTSDPLWGVTPQNVSRTLDLLGYLAADVGSSGMVDGIELLNEPAGFLQGAWPATISRFWQSGYDVVRDVVPGGNITVVIEDGFLGVQSWEGFLNAASGAINVLMDTHEYQIFNNTQLGFTWEEHINTACQAGPPLANFTGSGNIWTIIGEWSTAPTDCAMWLNGRNVGARWDGTYPGQTLEVFGTCSGLTGNSSEFSESYKTFLRQYWEAQVDAAEQANGWIYWAWKTESADEWSYQKGIEGGWIPNNSTERAFPSLCG